uniref:KfrA_N domain-containing protein n=1 Tax=Panagrellus redivivus TaxID=6233 RepID=A0A7E4VDW5_PANRE
MERLNAIIEKFFKIFSDDMISPKFLDQAIRTTFDNRTLPKADLEDICNEAKAHWLMYMRKKYQEICDKLELEGSFERLNELIAEQRLSRSKEVGWQRTGDVEADTYGSRRDVKLAHIQKLKAANVELEQALREKKDKLAKSKKELDAIIQQI